ncbi:MAG: deoxyribose-phosphate aldolase, partial [Oscillospiraceae bacterium]
MTNAEILSHIDHTLLRATSTAQEIDALCDEALRLKTASVCIPPSYVGYVHDRFPGLNICTVIGFPLGYNSTAVKCFEAQDAVKNGASEIDMVINLGMVKNGDFTAVEAEIAEVRKSCGGKLLKVIVET